MKKIFIILILFVSLISMGQEIKVKKKKENEEEGKATFYVLKDNVTIKHGLYQIEAYTGSRILKKGQYINNKKIGLWQEQYYGKEYKGPKASGNYDNDLKIGNWVYYNYDGDTMQIYNWTENKILFFKPCGIDQKEYTIIINGNEIKSKLDCPPTCVSGQHYFLYEFRRHITDYSESFKKIDDGLYQLKTRIIISVDNNSNVTEISYSTDENRKLKDIIEKFVRSYKWIPAKKDGENVTSRFEFSIALTSQF